MGGVKACVVDGSGDTCHASDPQWRVAHDDDGDGTVEVGLDPGVTYEVQGIANGTGWCNPWIGADGQDWHFGNTVSPVTADQLRGRLFVVPNPCPSTTEPTSTTVSPPPRFLPGRSPGDDHPGDDQSGNDQPATTQPATTQPATTEPGHDPNRQRRTGNDRHQRPER